MSGVKETCTPLIRRYISKRRFSRNQVGQKNKETSAYVGTVQNAWHEKTLKILLSRCTSVSTSVTKEKEDPVEKKTGEALTSVKEENKDDNLKKSGSCKRNKVVDAKVMLIDHEGIDNGLDNVFPNSDASATVPYSNACIKPWSKPMVCLHEGALDFLSKPVGKQLKRRMMLSDKLDSSLDSSKEPLTLSNPNQPGTSSDLHEKKFSLDYGTDDASESLTEDHTDRIHIMEFKKTRSSSKKCNIDESNLKVQGSDRDSKTTRKLCETLEMNIFPSLPLDWMEDNHVEEPDKMSSCLLSTESECKAGQLCRQTETNRNMMDSFFSSDPEMILTDVTLQESVQGSSMLGKESGHVNFDTEMPFFSPVLSEYAEAPYKKEESDEISDLSPHTIERIDFLESNLASRSNIDLPALFAEYSDSLPNQTRLKDMIKSFQFGSLSSASGEGVSGKFVQFPSPCTVLTTNQERSCTDNEVLAHSVDKVVTCTDVTYPVPNSNEHLELPGDVALGKDSPRIFHCSNGLGPITEDLDSALNKYESAVTVSDSFDANLKQEIHAEVTSSAMAYSNETVNVTQNLGSQNITLASVSPVKSCKTEVSCNDILEEKEFSTVAPAAKKVTMGTVHIKGKLGSSNCTQVNVSVFMTQRNPASPKTTNVDRVIEEVVEKYAASSLECSVPRFKKRKVSKSNTVDKIIQAVVAGNFCSGLNCDKSSLNLQYQLKTDAHDVSNENSVPVKHQGLTNSPLVAETHEKQATLSKGNVHEVFNETIVPIKQVMHKTSSLSAGTPDKLAPPNGKTRKRSHCRVKKCKSAERSDIESAEGSVTVSSVHYEEQVCKKSSFTAPSVSKFTSSCLPERSLNQDLKAFSSVLDNLPILSGVLIAKDDVTKTFTSPLDTSTFGKCKFNKRKDTSCKRRKKKECTASKNTFCDSEKQSEAVAGSDLNVDCNMVLRGVSKAEHSQSTEYAKRNKLSLELPSGVFISSALDEYDCTDLPMLETVDYSIKIRKNTNVNIVDHLIQKLNIQISEKEEDPSCLEGRASESDVTKSLPAPACAIALSMENTARSKPSGKSNAGWLSLSLNCARTDVVPLRKGNRDQNNFELKTSSPMYSSLKNKTVERLLVTNKKLKINMTAMLNLSSCAKGMEPDEHCEKFDSGAEIYKCMKDRKRIVTVAAQGTKDSEVNKKNEENAKGETESILENKGRQDAVPPNKQIEKHVDIKAKVRTTKEAKSRSETCNIDRISRKRKSSSEGEKQENQKNITPRQITIGKRSKAGKENVHPAERKPKSSRKSMKLHNIEMGSLKENHPENILNVSKEQEDGLRTSNLDYIPKVGKAVSDDCILMNKVMKANEKNRFDKTYPKVNDHNKGLPSAVSKIEDSTCKSIKAYMQLDNGNTREAQSLCTNVINLKGEQLNDIFQDSQGSSLEDFCITEKLKISYAIRPKKENYTNKRTSSLHHEAKGKKPSRPKKKKDLVKNLIFNLPKSLGKYKSLCKKASFKGI